MSFAEFTPAMWLPNFVALGTAIAIFLWLFRSLIPAVIGPSDSEIPRIGSANYRVRVGWELGIAISALLSCGFAGVPLVIPAIGGAVLMIAIAVFSGHSALRQTIGDVSWPLFVFVIGMTVIVRAVDLHVLDRITIPQPGSGLTGMALTMAAATLASNIINNVPATVLAGSVICRMSAPSQPSLAFATLIGANIGPALTTYGSLATMLWLTALRRCGIDITTRHYLRVSLITVQIVLLTITLTLWIVR